MQKMPKQYIKILGTDREIIYFREFSGTKEQALQTFLYESHNRDWYYNECEDNESWPQLSIVTVSDEEEIDVKEVMKAKEEKYKKRNEEIRLQSERQQYESLKKKFEK
jgi:hypothetical protein